jgi:hypothetical protein
MSLLDNGPDLVQVYPEIDTTDDYNNPIKAASNVPVPVAGRVQPSTSTESAELGQVEAEVVRFLSRDFPGGAFAKVSFDGRDWDVIGSPRRHRGSPRTAHTTTYLRARTAGGG